jgi:hypothetical protein
MQKAKVVAILQLAKGFSWNLWQEGESAILFCKTAVSTGH